MNAIRNCPICNSPGSEEFRAKWVQATKCGNPACGHIYAVDVSVGHGVQVHPEPNVERTAYERRDRKLVQYWLQQRFLTPNCSVLDFGAGAGHISKAVRMYGGTSRITCMEADPASQVNLRAEGFLVVANLSECSESFDAILLVEVIEHLDEPVALLRALKEHLNPGGKIFLSTPCGELPSGSRKTNAYDTPEHIHFFSEKSLRLAMQSAGLVPGPCLTVPAMYPHGTSPVSVLQAWFKGHARILRDKVRGFSHLILFAG